MAASGGMFGFHDPAHRSVRNVPRLDGVTLCAVSSREPWLALRAMNVSMRGVDFGDALLCAPVGFHSQVGEKIRCVDIPVFHSVRQYSEFLLASLLPHIITPHVLIVQWDGYVLHPDAWCDAFLEYDYIGAPWPHFPAERSVGNGGFSLRSRRLMEAMLDSDFVPSHPEDVSICHRNRRLLEDRYGIRFAPVEVAERFSYERRRPNVTTFGFHGFFNFPDFMSPEELNDLLDDVPVEVLCNRDARDLILRLMSEGSKEGRRLARKILSRRLVFCPWSFKNFSLALKCGMTQFSYRNKGSS